MTDGGDHYGETPFHLYSFKEPEHWEEFQTQNETEEAKHELAASQATTSADIAGSSTELGSHLGREDSWLQGHTPGKQPEVTDPAQMEIRDRIVQLKKEVAAGTFVPDGHNDVLTRALRTAKHLRQTRGVGSYSGLRKVFKGNMKPRKPEADYIVAHGSVFPRAPGDVVHGVSLLPHQVKVSVTLVHPGIGEYTISCPTEHIETIADCEESFVAWPKSLVGLGDPQCTRLDMATSHRPNFILFSAYAPLLLLALPYMMLLTGAHTPLSGQGLGGYFGNGTCLNLRLDRIGLMFPEYPNNQGTLSVFIIRCDFYGSSSLSMLRVLYRLTMCFSLLRPIPHPNEERNGAILGRGFCISFTTDAKSNLSICIAGFYIGSKPMQKAISSIRRPSRLLPRCPSLDTVHLLTLASTSKSNHTRETPGF
ncbi:unnamed protein product [Cuscuta campestris]|uniref:DUF8039 domain-containing protein n=1 Tax=Cuscuta campestris TaxID=132261 RepID=A0A484MD64_9ASTE|nr:unnamed protein product [Cuscuta campestris]